ncbi:MAG: reverse transcriptase domain-containing protein [Candidatus Sedimenticola sp. (ex Thyasira tokunagai)]
MVPGKVPGREAKPKGEALLVRYADDFVCAFRYREDAERFYRTLPKRLGKFGLELSPEKTRLIRFSRFHPGGKRRICFWALNCTGGMIAKGDLAYTGERQRRSWCRRSKGWGVD